ncbi:MAG: hypothetical protein AB7O52_12885 [Planctomycetota bacterium]
MNRRLGIWASAWCLGLTVVTAMLLSMPARCEEDVKDSNPTFSDPEAQRLFNVGRDFFEKNDWKSAETSFKDCKAQAAAAEKKQLDEWLKACKGGKDLDKIQKLTAKSAWRAAWGEIRKLAEKYPAPSPLQPKIDEVSRYIESELFYFLATFEEEAPEPERATGARPESATVNTETRYVKAGNRSLRWAATYDLGLISQLPLATFDGAKIDDYRYLHLSIYSGTKDFGKFTLFFDINEQGRGLNLQDPTRVLQTPGFFYHITVNQEGWLDLRIDLWEELQTHSNPTRDQIRGVSLLMIPPSKPKTLYLDDFKLERK